MPFPQYVLGIYRSALKRIRRWGLPLGLAILYLTAAGRTSDGFSDRLSHLGLVTIHRLAGCMVLLVLVILLYDAILRLVTRQDNPSSWEMNDLAEGFLAKVKANSQDTLVNYVFFVLLIWVAVGGIVIFGLSLGGWPNLRAFELVMRFVHCFSGWLLLSLMTLKYYLVVTRWFRGMIIYLRES